MATAYLQNTIKAIRYQIKALDESLEMLEGLIEAQKAEKDAEKEVLRCPVCHSAKLSSMPLMGPDRQYFCEDCDFKGQLNSL